MDVARERLDDRDIELPQEIDYPTRCVEVAALLIVSIPALSVRRQVHRDWRGPPFCGGVLGPGLFRVDEATKQSNGQDLRSAGLHQRAYILYMPASGDMQPPRAVTSLSTCQAVCWNGTSLRSLPAMMVRRGSCHVASALRTSLAYGDLL